MHSATHTTFQSITHRFPVPVSNNHQPIQSHPSPALSQPSISFQPQPILPHPFVKAVPSASPLVTPEMGERLCRMASQHYMSDYNRYKRGLHPNPVIAHQASQFNNYPAYTSSVQLHSSNSHALQSSTQSIKTHHASIPTAHLPYTQTSLPSAPSLSHLPHPLTEKKPAQDPNLFHFHSTVVHPPIVIKSLRNSSKPELSLLESSNTPHTTFTASQTQETITNTNQHRTPDPAQSDHLADCSKANSAEKRKLRNRTPSPAEANHHPATQPADRVTVSALNNEPPIQRVDSIVKTSQTHPMNISPIVPPELANELADFCLKFHTGHRHHDQKLVPVDLYELTGSNASRAYEEFHAHHQQRFRDLSQTHQGSAETGCRLGNMLLSSCPGKKVRMFNQPAGSRSPICRNLRSDLSRAQSLGIRAIVCCLDDEELSYLGSPWAEYETVAAECGLAVMRLPMAEGYAPSKGVEEIDRVLEAVLENFTRKGLDVLCHCRGGVGRAGLVACCWMLKIGLINKPAESVKDTPFADPSISIGVHAHQQQQQLVPRPSVLAQVEKVIEVIRRRRSVKAIETPQQVHFIMEYASWLDRELRAS